MSTQVIPVRELNQHTSAVLKRVQSGEELLVSISGKVVARLTPISRDETALHELAARGQAILATNSAPFTMPPVLGDPTLDSLDSTEVVSQLREESY
jgi:prevent-host-death family protein